ncbi:MAG: lytic murein transglycosylase B [Gammaproteobacteria bacterium]|nr:lytic murein transglycosylase B [Gammaproteobacteria bacterium]
MLLALAVITGSGSAIADKPADFDSQVASFAEEMQRKHGFDASSLDRLLGPARYRQSIIDAITRPAEAKPWSQYRKIFVTDSRIRQGVEFWQANEALLGAAEREFGVPPEIIVAIIGVETRYGRHIGTYPVVDALTTLAFAYPKRSRFFTKELEEFLLLSHEEQLQGTVVGSYAGAMGKPQFIPSSYRAYAIDFDGDGQRNLWESNADVIGSVAAYFKRHGWQGGAPITGRARGVNASHAGFVAAGMMPSIRLETLRAAGIGSDQPFADDALASLIELDGDQGTEHWLGLHNFYVITRYNHSNLYAMAVHQLSREILSERARTGGATR